MAAVPIDPAEPHGAVVYGVSFPRQDVRENLARRFRRDPRDLYAIGLLHANVGVNTGHEPYAPCTLEDLGARRHRLLGARARPLAQRPA